MARQHQRLRQRPTLRRRHRDVAAGECELDSVALEGEQFARREARRPARRLLRLDELDAREAHQLVGKLEHVLNAPTRGKRAGDRLHQFRRGERCLFLGHAVAA